MAGLNYLTVGDLTRWLQRLRKDGLQNDSPVIVINGNPHVSSKGALMVRQMGYYAGWIAQRAAQAKALYFSVKDPCMPSDVEWDEVEAGIIAERRKAKDTVLRPAVETNERSWRESFDLTFGG